MESLQDLIVYRLGGPEGDMQEEIGASLTREANARAIGMIWGTRLPGNAAGGLDSELLIL